MTYMHMKKNNKVQTLTLKMDQDKNIGTNR